MIKTLICCLVLIIGSVEVGLDIDMKFHQEVMEIVSYDIYKTYVAVYNLLEGMYSKTCFEWDLFCTVSCLLRHDCYKIYVLSLFYGYVYSLICMSFAYHNTTTSRGYPFSTRTTIVTFQKSNLKILILLLSLM